MDKRLRELILNHVASFGPNRNGSNILIITEHASEIFNNEGDRMDK